MVETRSIMHPLINIVDHTTASKHVGLHHHSIKTHFHLHLQVGLHPSLAWLASLVDLPHRLLAMHHMVVVNNRTTPNHPTTAMEASKDMPTAIIMTVEAVVIRIEVEVATVRGHVAETHIVETMAVAKNTP